MSTVTSVVARASTEQALQWLALGLTPGLGPGRARRLVEHFGSICGCFSGFPDRTRSHGPPGLLGSVPGNRELTRTGAGGAPQNDCSRGRGVSLDDPAYPTRLKEIYDPPLVLYVRGDVHVLSQPGIAMVGTRHPTPYGTGMAERLAIDLAARGLIIISGMARGVDSAAHRGAIAARARRSRCSVPVSMCPILRRTAGSRSRSSVWVERSFRNFLSGLFQLRRIFPFRNRIISGMSMGVLVVEAAESSGTRSTARCALEQNREVFAVLGNVTNKNSWGPNTLIKQGAKLVATWEDVWEEMPENVRLALTPAKIDESSTGETASLFPSEDNPLKPARAQDFRPLLKADEATQIDEIVERLEPDMSSSEIFAALFELEHGRGEAIAGEEFCEKLLSSSP